MEIDEAIESIIDDLDPLQEQWREANIRKDLAKRLNSLRPYVESFLRRSAKVKTRSDAQAINATITKLKRQLWRASPEMQARLGLDRWPKLFHELAEVEAECARAIAVSKSGKNAAKKWCAVTAYTLIAKYSEKDPTSGSDVSKFRHLTGVLYSYCIRLNENDTKDLKRACDAAMRLFRKAGVESKRDLAKKAKDAQVYRRRIARALKAKGV